MTNLIDVERTYLALKHLVLEKVAVYFPQCLVETTTFLEEIDTSSIHERTLCVAQLLNTIEQRTSNQEWLQAKQVLEEQQVSHATIAQLEKYMP